MVKLIEMKVKTIVVEQSSGDRAEMQKKLQSCDDKVAHINAPVMAQTKWRISLLTVKK